VLEPLSGYLSLAASLDEATGVATRARPGYTDLCSAFNFGPNLTSNRSVAELVREVLKHWPGEWVDRSDPNAVHEAKLLNLATDKAFHILGWKPAWSFEKTIEETISWYRDSAQHIASAELHALTLRQISKFTEDARMSSAAWAQAI
jgi:CDP-glucose 4,6-dehydratase